MAVFIDDTLRYTFLSSVDLQLLIESLNLDSRELLAGNGKSRIKQFVPGELLIIPGWTTIKYVVRPRDTIDRLSHRFGIPAFLIRTLNNLFDTNLLHTRQILILPEACPSR